MHWALIMTGKVMSLFILPYLLSNLDVSRYDQGHKVIVILLLSPEFLVKDKRIQFEVSLNRKGFIMDYSLLAELFGMVMEKAVHTG